MSSVKKFFQLVYDECLSKVEMYSEVETLSGGFNVDKLNYLYQDFKIFYNVKLHSLQDESGEDTTFFAELFELMDLQDIIEEKLGNKENKVAPLNVWNLFQRYKFIESLGFIDLICNGNTLSQKERDLMVQQILGCDNSNARKLIGGQYQKGANATDQEQERKELYNKWLMSKPNK